MTGTGDGRRSGKARGDTRLLTTWSLFWQAYSEEVDATGGWAEQVEKEASVAQTKKAKKAKKAKTSGVEKADGNEDEEEQEEGGEDETNQGSAEETPQQRAVAALAAVQAAREQEVAATLCVRHQLQRMREHERMRLLRKQVVQAEVETYRRVGSSQRRRRVEQLFGPGGSAGSAVSGSAVSAIIAGGAASAKMLSSSSTTTTTTTTTTGVARKTILTAASLIEHVATTLQVRLGYNAHLIPVGSQARTMFETSFRSELAAKVNRLIRYGFNGNIGGSRTDVNGTNAVADLFNVVTGEGGVADTLAIMRGVGFRLSPESIVVSGISTSGVRVTLWFDEERLQRQYAELQHSTHGTRRAHKLSPRRTGHRARRVGITKVALTTFYRQYNPSKIADVDRIMASFSPEDLVQALFDEYGAVPSGSAHQHGEIFDPLDDFDDDDEKGNADSGGDGYSGYSSYGGSEGYGGDSYGEEVLDVDPVLPPGALFLVDALVQLVLECYNCTPNPLSLPLLLSEEEVSSRGSSALTAGLLERLDAKWTPVVLHDQALMVQFGHFEVNAVPAASCYYCTYVTAVLMLLLYVCCYCAHTTTVLMLLDLLLCAELTPTPPPPLTTLTLFLSLSVSLSLALALSRSLSLSLALSLSLSLALSLSLSSLSLSLALSLALSRSLSLSLALSRALSLSLALYLFSPHLSTSLTTTTATLSPGEWHARVEGAVREKVALATAATAPAHDAERVWRRHAGRCCCCCCCWWWWVFASSVQACGPHDSGGR
jgi:hypothetical protein